MEQHEGLYGRERGSFLWVVQDGEKESRKLGLMCGWENMRVYYLTSVFLDFS
jgi:hypothetical protein